MTQAQTKTERPAGADNEAAKAAITKRKEAEEEANKAAKVTLSGLVQAHASKLLGDERAAQFAAQVAILRQNNPGLEDASASSLLAAMMACVHTDLMPNTPAQLAFIIPYKDHRSGRVNAQFQIGYKGLATLAYRSGQVRIINAELVFNGDTFRVEFGTDRKLVHHPNFDVDRTDYKNVTHAYATATLSTGEVKFEVMTRAELNKIQETAKAKSSDSPWKLWPSEMAKKTVVKRLAKLLPSDSKDQRLAYAAYIDNLAEVGRLKVTDQGDIIEGETGDEPDEPTNNKEIKNYAVKAIQGNDVPKPRTTADKDESDESGGNEAGGGNPQPTTPKQTTDQPADADIQSGSETDGGGSGDESQPNVGSQSEDPRTTEQILEAVKSEFKKQKVGAREQMALSRIHAGTPVLGKADRGGLLALEGTLTAPTLTEPTV